MLLTRSGLRVNILRIILLFQAAICIECNSSQQNHVLGNKNSPLSRQQKLQSPPSSKNATDQQQVEDILKDTMLLLDVLDDKLDKVKNGTTSAMNKDNLRALVDSGAYELTARGSFPDHVNEEADAEESSIEEALVRLADGFSSGRKADGSPDMISPMASEPQPVATHKQAAATSGRGARQLTPDEYHYYQQLAQQQQQQHKQQNQHHSASDSTDRHIKFTLDLMQSIFASQSYSAKTNLIESFLISPLSIQMVLMMMHLGSRGQTRREISNCLHLTTTSNLDNSSSSVISGSSNNKSPSLLNNDLGADPMGVSKLKRRHQQTVSSSELGISKVLGAGVNKSQQQASSLRHQATSSPKQQQASSSSSSTTNAAPTANTSTSTSSAAATSTNSAAASTLATSSNNQAHELFGAAMRNLLKDPIVMKALTSANQIFLQKNLPLAAQYEWAIKHYYGADVKLVDFQHQSSSSAAAMSAADSGLSAASTSNVAPGDKTKPLTAAGSNVRQSANSSADQQPATSDEFGKQNSNVQQMINDWIERQTNGRISNFLSSPISTSTLMMAINVLYFKGDWQYKFDPSDTESDAWFTQTNGKTVKIPMMVNRLPLAFAHDAAMKTSVIELPYKAQRLGLFLLLPDEVGGIFHTMQMLNSSSFANLISSMRKPSPNADQGSSGINVRIPKFSIESSPRLSQVLSQQLGLKSLFMPDVADLSAMFASPSAISKRTTNNSSIASETNNGQQVPQQVALDELLHKAVLQVDEQGSVAAASSATIVERVGLFNSNYFEADHPFLLFLMDKQTGLVLFSGAFAGNNQQEPQQQQQQGSHQRHTRHDEALRN